VDLADRQTDLLLRLERGIPSDLLDLARACRDRLTRAEYLRLRAIGLGTADTVANASVEDVAKQLGGGSAQANAVLELVRAASDAASRPLD
jgi:hypothetical protein